MEQRTLLALMVFSSLLVLAETIDQKVFALFLLSISRLLIWWCGGIAVTGQVMQVTPLVTTTWGVLGGLCWDFRALGYFKVFLVVCLGCYSTNVAGGICRCVRSCSSLGMYDTKFERSVALPWPLDEVWILTQNQASTMLCQDVSDECLIIYMEWKRAK